MSNSGTSQKSSDLFFRCVSLAAICTTSIAAATLMLSLGACSGSPSGAVIHPFPVGKDTGGDDKKKTPVQTDPLSINDLWFVTAKSCHGAPINLDPTETYRLSMTLLVRIVGDADTSTDNQYCEDSFAYLRAPTSPASNVSGVYSESSIASSQMMTANCYRISKKHVIKNPPISTSPPVIFGPEQFASVISATPNAITLTLVTPTDCPAGNLVLTLKKTLASASVTPATR